MNYIVLEIQTTDGTTNVIHNVYDNQAQAESKYYTILSFAALSEVPVHSAVLMNQNGQVFMSQVYDRSAIAD